MSQYMEPSQYLEPHQLVSEVIEAYRYSLSLRLDHETLNHNLVEYQAFLDYLDKYELTSSKLTLLRHLVNCIKPRIDGYLKGIRDSHTSLSEYNRLGVLSEALTSWIYFLKRSSYLALPLIRETIDDYNLMKKEPDVELIHRVGSLYTLPFPDPVGDRQVLEYLFQLVKKSNRQVRTYPSIKRVIDTHLKSEFSSRGHQLATVILQAEGSHRQLLGHDDGPSQYLSAISKYVTDRFEYKAGDNPTVAVTTSLLRVYPLYMDQVLDFDYKPPNNLLDTIAKLIPQSLTSERLPGFFDQSSNPMTSYTAKSDALLIMVYAYNQYYESNKRDSNYLWILLVVMASRILTDKLTIEVFCHDYTFLTYKEEQQLEKLLFDYETTKDESLVSEITDKLDSLNIVHPISLDIDNDLSRRIKQVMDKASRDRELIVQANPTNIRGEFFFDKMSDRYPSSNQQELASKPEVMLGHSIDESLDQTKLECVYKGLPVGVQELMVRSIKALYPDDSIYVSAMLAGCQTWLDDNPDASLADMFVSFNDTFDTFDSIIIGISQDRYNRWLDDISYSYDRMNFYNVISELPNLVDEDSSHRSWVKPINVMTEYVERQGYIWNGYFAYINPRHPFYKTMTGELPLRPENFEYGVGPFDAYLGELIVSRIKSTNIKRYDDILIPNFLDDRDQQAIIPWRKTGWSKDMLIGAIHRAGLMMAERTDVIDDMEGGKLVHNEDYYPDLRRVLTLDLITGIPQHRKLVIPGIGIDPPSSNAIKEWARPRVKSWLHLIYRYLYSTMGYVEPERLENMGLTLPQLKRLTNQLYGYTKKELRGATKNTIYQLVKDEHYHRKMVSDEIKNYLENEQGAVALILQPNSVWVMDAVGNYRPYLFDEQDHLDPVPEEVLPKELEDLWRLYQYVCDNRDSIDLGAIHYIAQQLNIELSHQQISSLETTCEILENAFKSKFIKKDELDLMKDLPLSYRPYVKMCQVPGSVSKDELKLAASELGIEDMLRDDNLSETEICDVIKKYLYTLKRSHVKQD